MGVINEHSHHWGHHLVELEVPVYETIHPIAGRGSMGGQRCGHSQSGNQTVEIKIFLSVTTNMQIFQNKRGATCITITYDIANFRLGFLTAGM
jgi:hypothetical protein